LRARVGQLREFGDGVALDDPVTTFHCLNHRDTEDTEG
jgi:hypothetical protein